MFAESTFYRSLKSIQISTQITSNCAERTSFQLHNKVAQRKRWHSYLARYRVSRFLSDVQKLKFTPNWHARARYSKEFHSRHEDVNGKVEGDSPYIVDSLVRLTLNCSFMIGVQWPVSKHSRSTQARSNWKVDYKRTWPRTKSSTYYRCSQMP